jgi:hypothetical protein
MNQHSSPLFVALNAAANGYAVLPADASGAPLVPIEEASTDPEVIRSWWEKYPKAVPGALPPKPKGLKATAFVWRDPKTIPPRKYLYGGHLIRKFASAKFAAGGVGKSILALTEAIAMATGRALLGITPRQRCRVWYWNGEDPREETERRIAAICLHFGIKAEELEGWLFIDSGREQEIIIAVHNPKTGATIAEPVVKSLIDTMLDNEIDVLIIDPFVSSHRVTENDTMAMEMVAKQWTKIADETDTAIELIHHTRKTSGAEATVEDGRGAVAVLAAVRSAQVLNKMTPDEGTKAGVDNHREYFKVENGKPNLAPPPEGKDWYRIVSVSLGNGDGGVAAEAPDALNAREYPAPTQASVPFMITNSMKAQLKAKGNSTKAIKAMTPAQAHAALAENSGQQDKGPIDFNKARPQDERSGIGAMLDKGDSVGVVVSWKWPNPLDGVTGADFEAVAKVIRAGRWRESIQAKDWVGRAVAKALKLDLDNKRDKAKAAGLVNIWIKQGSLIVVEEQDDKRMMRKYVRVADAA